MAQTRDFIRGFLALSCLILQLFGCLFAATFPITKKRRSPDQKLSSWSSIKRLLTCKSDKDDVYDPKRESPRKKCHNSIGMGCKGSIRDIVQGSAKVMHKAESSPESSSRSSSQEIVVSDTTTRMSMGSSARSLPSPKPMSTAHDSSQGSSFRGVHLKKLSGCYECNAVVDPLEATPRDLCIRATLCACQICGEVFSMAEALQIHQASKHAVSELAHDDSARNIVDIIFQTSWLKKEIPCKIDKILKIHNSQKTINKFEDYRDMVKAKANKSTKKHPRCLADGNELLRFHCTTFTCSLSLNGCANLCNLVSCNVCNIIRYGFPSNFDNGKGIYTTSSSGKAHDSIEILEEEALKVKRAMVVCRVIAGRVSKSQDLDECLNGVNDSMAGQAGTYSNLDELFVFNSEAVLPCFVVMYRASKASY